jgi:hypothetical protein
MNGHMMSEEIKNVIRQNIETLTFLVESHQGHVYDKMACLRTVASSLNLSADKLKSLNNPKQ